MKKLIFAFTSILLVIPCHAKTITVDDDGSADFNNIQAAINSASNGDEIEVSPGTYYEAINFNRKAVRLYSSDGQDVTTIDGTGYYRVVQCLSGEDANTILEGFTITGGSNTPPPEDGGGAMRNSGSSPTVINCTFKDNSGYYSGGIENWGSSPTVVNCTLTGNTAFYGGGMYNNESSSPTVTNCMFSGNLAYSMGGGMYNQDSDPTVTNCTFTGNSAEFGGGMQNLGNPTVTNCTFTNNSAVDGGGMQNWGNPTVTNCSFSNNTASLYGGGMYNGNGGLTLTNCTFSVNSANSGGGMFNYKNSAIVTNCILWDDTPDEIVDNQSSSTVSYSDIQGGWPGLGNIDTDPCFADSSNDDYHLKSIAGRWDANSESWVKDEVTSPCIDTGDPNLDWTKELWPHGKRINMGAYGGTPQASMSLSDTGNIADLNNDDKVDFGDLKLITNKWPYHKILLPEDFDRNGFVDFDDFAIFGLQWSYPSALEPGITYQIEDCNRDASVPFAAEPPDLTRFKVTVEGLYIHFEDMMTANCCPDKLELEMAVEDSLITIYETEYTSEGCRCMCSFPITATLGPFEPGIYTLEVYEEWSGFIGSTTVVIEPPE